MSHSFSFEQIVVLLRLSWRRIALISGICVFTAVALSLALPKWYTASATIVIDTKPKDQLDGTTSPGPTGSNYLTTQATIIRSERVGLIVIERLKLDEIVENRERWVEETEGAGDYKSWLFEKIAKRLSVTPAKDSSVIEISFVAKDPALARDVTNAFIQAYLDVSAAIRSEPARTYTSFFDDRTKMARETLEKAQQALSDYERRKGILASDERLDIEAARLNDLSSTYIRLQEMATESGGRDAQARARPDSSAETLRDPVVAGLRTEISKQEASRQQLMERLGANHPQVIERTANLEALRQLLREQTNRVTQSLGADRNVTAAKLSETRKLMEQQREKVAALKESRDEARVLRREVENAQRAYDAILSRFTQTNLESGATQTNATVVKWATEPGLPSSPRTLLNTAVGLLLGLIGASGYILIREAVNRRLRTAEDVLRVMRQPFLGVVPKFNVTSPSSLEGASGRVKRRILAANAAPALMKP